MSQEILLAVDGGNSKTDVVLARGDGAVLSFVRGPMSSPDHLGLEGALEVLGDLLEQAARRAALSSGGGPIADVAHLLMAGVDFPGDEQELREAAQQRHWAKRTSVDNDTLAVLRAGTERGWGVAVVCGTGMNCVGVGPDGRRVRFLSLGEITGDWGGGHDVGRAALSAAARSADRRGPRTALESAVPRHFGLATPADLAEAIHRGRIPERRLAELPPLVFAQTEVDPVAAAIVDRLADEIVAFARAAVERLGLGEERVEVLIGGGLLQSGNGRLTSRIEAGLRQQAPATVVSLVGSPPIVGAALLGLDELRAGRGAQARLRRELTTWVSGTEARGRTMAGVSFEGGAGISDASGHA